MEKLKKIIGKIWNSATASLAITVFLFILAEYAAYAVERILMEITPGTDFWAMGVVYACFIGIWVVFVAVMLIFKRDRVFLKKLGPDSGNTWKNIFLGALLGFGTNALCILLAILTKKIFISPADAKPIGWLLLLLMFVVVQSGAEELVCRLFLFQRIKRTYNNGILATIISALFFSMLHIFNKGVTVLALVNITIIGILYALIIYYFDAFWTCALAHTLWNYTQNIIFGLPNSGMVSSYSIFKLDAAIEENSFFYHNEFGVESTGTAAAINLLMIVLVVYFGRKKKQKELLAAQEEKTSLGEERC